MKKDLKSSIRNRKTARQPEEQSAKDQAFAGLTPQQAMLLKSLQGKSQQELQDAFYHTAQQQINNDAFDETAILEMIDRMGTMITREQKDRMYQMLRSLHGGG